MLQSLDENNVRGTWDAGREGKGNRSRQTTTNPFIGKLKQFDIWHTYIEAAYLRSLHCNAVFDTLYSLFHTFRFDKKTNVFRLISRQQINQLFPSGVTQIFHNIRARINSIYSCFEFFVQVQLPNEHQADHYLNLAALFYLLLIRDTEQ